MNQGNYFDPELDQDFVLITINTDLETSETGLLYKKRWEVELLFKWMKQHLKINFFWGTTVNAV